MDIDRIIEIVRTLKEEAPTVSVAAGGVAGYDLPLGKKKRPSILAKGCMKGARTRWKTACR